jgi:hypothetical protein
MVNTFNQSQTELKKALRQGLAAHGGDPNHGAVATTIDQLTTLNPTAAPARQTDLLDGDWLLISAPNFPDGELRVDGTYAYTLGRLAFNMFQPKDLKVLINQVSQPVFPIEGTSQRTHDIVVQFTTLSEDFPPLQGLVRNLGICQPASDNTLQVQFTGGVLEPVEGTELKVWQQVFGQATAPARLSLKEWFQGLLLRFMFGLVLPDKMDTQTGRSEFQMKRSPKGSLEILYLDEELRITKGEKGTVLVCDRVTDCPQ